MKNALFVIVVLLAPLSVVAAPYSYYFHYYNNGGYKIIFESLSGASRGLDSFDTPPYPPAFSPSDVGLTIYKQMGTDGWDSNAGFCVRDARPILQLGQTEIVSNIYLWAGTAVTPLPLQLTYGSYYSRFSPGVTYKLRLVQIPVGVTYTGPTEWGPTHGTITLPFYATDDATTGYKFRAEVTAVPEPSSLLALCSGMGGMAFLLRRRR